MSAPASLTAESSHPAIVQVLSADTTGVRFHALAAGTATIRAVATDVDGTQYTRSLLMHVRDPTSVALTFECIPRRDSTRAIIPVGSQLSTHSELLAGTVALAGFGPLALVSDGATFTNRAGTPDYDVHASPTPIDTSITSPNLPSYRLPLRVYAPGEVTGLQLEETAPPPHSATNSINYPTGVMVELLVDGERACTEPAGWTHHLSITTPDVCAFIAGDPSAILDATTLDLTDAHLFFLAGRRRGLCHVDAVSQETGRAAGLDVPFGGFVRDQ